MMSVVDIYDIRRSSYLGFESSLDKEEREKANRFRFAEDRERFICSRGGTRVLLGKILECDPRSIEFSFNEYGKPFLKDTGLSFNASHSGDIILIAVTSAGFEIGVDVELTTRDASFSKIAQQFFSGQEYELVKGFKDEKLRKAFYRIWTRKEAFIKAVGEGLTHPLDSFVVSHGEEASIVSSDRHEDLANWSIESLDLQPNYEAACVVLGASSLNIQQKRWEASLPTFKR